MTGFQIDPTTGAPIPGATQPPQTMFTVDPKRGLMDHTFPDAVMLHDTQANGYTPTPSTWPNDPNLLPAVQHVLDINARYDAVVANHPEDAGNALRYIDLVAVSSNAGVSPLNTIPNAQLVPGSEVVRGPDQRPGPTYGREVVYIRLPSTSAVGSIGPNEYIIRYADIPGRLNVAPSGDQVYDDMRNALQKAGTIIFDSQAQSNGSFHALPTTLDPGNSPGAPPAAPIIVTYQFQTNSTGNTVREDYLTRQLMTFSLGVRLYEFNSRQPQQFNMTQKIKVRNLQR
jgi:hypothetical protein